MNRPDEEPWDLIAVKSLPPLSPSSFCACDITSWLSRDSTFATVLLSYFCYFIIIISLLAHTLARLAKTWS